MDIKTVLEYGFQSQPFSAIVQTHELPIVIKYDSSQPLDKTQVTSSFDPTVPLLVHSKHRVRQIRGYCVKFQKETKTIDNCNRDVTIPENYDGWFGVFGSPSSQTREPIVPHYRRVSQLAISPCTAFLVAGDRPVDALRIDKHDGEKIDFLPVQLLPGSVLKKGKLFAATVRTKVQKKFRKKEKVQEIKYLSVSDTLGSKYFIPCETEGLFFIIQTGTRPVQVPILKAEEIIERYSFPVLVQLVQGSLPYSPSFKGSLILHASEFVSIATAISINSKEQLLFEISCDSSLKFLSSSRNGNSLEELEEYKDALPHLQNRVDKSLKSFRSHCIADDDTDSTNSRTNESVNTDPATPSAKRLDITQIETDETRLFPNSPRPINPTTSFQLSTNSVLSLNSNQLKRSMTYERPKDLSSDVIPTSSDNASSNSSNESYSIPGKASSIRSSKSISLSGSECSSCSSSSQPSLPDSTSGLDSSEENLMTFPPPPPDMLIDLQECCEDDNQLNTNLPDEECSMTYSAVWNSGSLINEFDSTPKVSPNCDDLIKHVSIDSNRSGAGVEIEASKCNPSGSKLEDENGYMIPSSITEILNDEVQSRGADSYMSMSSAGDSGGHLDNVYVQSEEITEQGRQSKSSNLYSNDEDQITEKGNQLNTLNPYVNSEKISKQLEQSKTNNKNLSRQSHISTGSHFYESLDDVIYNDLNDEIIYSRPNETRSQYDSTDSGYVNYPPSNASTNGTSRSSINKCSNTLPNPPKTHGSCNRATGDETSVYQNISTCQTLLRNSSQSSSQTTTACEDNSTHPYTSNQAALCQELSSVPWKDRLRHTPSAIAPNAHNVTNQRCKQSPSESCEKSTVGFINVQQKSGKAQLSGNVNRSVDSFLRQLEQYKVSKGTREALSELSEADFMSVVQAEESLEALKEQFPNISKSDIFKIGICLKDV